MIKPARIRINKVQGMDVQTVPITALNPHPKNSRHHDETNLRAIMASLRKHGQRTPIVANPDGYVVKGNGTLEAAQRLGWREIGVLFHLFPSEAHEIAYMVADNKTGDLSEFNFQFLTENLQELQDAGFDMESTGFSEYEIEPLLSTRDWEPEAENENVPGPTKSYEGAEKVNSIPFTLTMKKAAARFRKRNHFPDLTPPEALEALCALYIKKELK